MACECGPSQCATLIKILNIICGLFLIALGVLRFIFNSQLKNFLQFLLSVYYILFGAVIILTELNWEFIKNQFSFQKEYKGRGLFLIFVGILCFDSIDFTQMIGILNFSCGIVTCTFGVLSFLFGPTNQNSQTNHNNQIKYENPISNKPNENVGVSRI